MSKNYALQAEARDGAGKGAARALRRDGKTPAVIYGDNKEPVKISLNSNALNTEYNKGHMFTTLCDMDVNGETHLVLARDVQLHPVTDVAEHADFLRVTKKTKIKVFVPVQFLGEEESPGMKARGTLNVVRHEVELWCSATSIPEMLEVNMGDKDLGDAIKVSDANLPEGTTPAIDDRDFTIATIVAPRTAEEVEEADAEVAETDMEADGSGEAPAEGEGDAAEGGE